MPEKPRQGTWAFIKGLSRVEWLTLGVLGLAQFCSAVTFACIVPFFPAEATRKGLNTTQVGLLIGVFQLVGFLVSPILGKFMVQLGPKRLFTGGLLIGGFGAILFGLLRILPSGPAFFWTALLVRSVKALGSACFATSSLTIVAQSFPGKVGSVMSFMEICLGLGYTVGPLIGSVLYELGGFPLPFFVLGSLMLGSAAVSLLVLLRERAAIVDDNGMGKAKKVAEEEPKPLGQEAGWRLLAIPELWLTCWAIATLEASCFFYDASITEHLSDLEGGGPMLVGLMISLVSVTYLMTAPFLGWFIDRWPRTSGWIMLAGSLLIAVATSLMGPSPLLPLDKSVGSVSAAFALLGVAISPFFIPTFQHCINAARDHGFDEASTANCGLISGFLQGSNSLGGFLGATLGGASVSCFGFAWTATGVSGLNLCWFIAQAIFCVQKALRTNLAEKLPKRPLDLPVPADPSSTASISSSIAPQIIP